MDKQIMAMVRHPVAKPKTVSTKLYCKLLELIRVYETRLSINLFETWEKFVAHFIVLAMVSLITYTCILCVKMVTWLSG